ncbi:SOS response-associated peptidase family protein [Enterovibrio nigricans]|uniref:Abasic site processing protein n=1 Tax=Enterovibrio nigricans DSM 22720 TaxID=1121868 RepID=A0A1T4VTZ5_9GAMM|nr:SOS response-associated peptidase family protein [Enterovibrio nigricans]PKF49100.1 DUF159 family protein [Enterovibrio nigricans]SKA68436.1 Putative SOS response-associated peptidase YedK [Enterovibrio nigricans DSM 22720]
MCGRFNVTDDPYMHALLQELGIDLGPLPLRVCEDIAPSQLVCIVIKEDGQNVLRDAIWWLLLEQVEAGFKPLSKYASFNTRSDKLKVPRSAGYVPFRQSRCIIPASGFVETEQGHAFTLEPIDDAIAFGGLYKAWRHTLTGEVVHSCSIVTLPPHPRIALYHSKSIPLMLPDEAFIREMWLDGNLTSTDALTPLLTPLLPFDVRVTPIKRASEREPIGSPNVVTKDDAA